MPKHTILFLAANPLGTDRLALDEEARAIQHELERSRHRNRFEFVTRWAARPLDLLHELRKLKPTVIHFSGLGWPGQTGASGPSAVPYRDVVSESEAPGGGHHEHGLFFQGPDGRPQLVSTAALKEALGAAGASVGLVVLSACYTEVQAEALLPHVACVVWLGGSIHDDAARTFAIGFYGGLGDRESVAAAYRQGCAAISLEGLPTNERPQLKVRDGISAEKIVFADAGLTDINSFAWGIDQLLEVSSEMLNISDAVKHHTMVAQQVAGLLDNIVECLGSIASLARKGDFSACCGSCEELGIYLENFAEIQGIPQLAGADKTALLHSLASAVQARAGMYLANSLVGTRRGSEFEMARIVEIERAAGRFRAASALVKGGVGHQKAKHARISPGEDRSLTHFDEFDVFLCHNSADKEEIQRVAERLRGLGLKPYIHDRELELGQPARQGLAEQIRTAKAFAVFVGANGLDPSQKLEIGAAWGEHVKRKCPVIPVLLPDRPRHLQLPIFLSRNTWVNLREIDPDPIDQLYSLITGEE